MPKFPALTPWGGHPDLRAPQVQAQDDAQLIALWLARKNAERTRQAYAVSVARLGRFTQYQPLVELTLPQLHLWRESMQPELAPRTINQHLSAVKSLLSFGHLIGYLGVNVGTGLQPSPLPPRPTARLISEQAWLDILAAVGTGARRQGARNQCLLRCLYYSGARIGELLQLRWRDVTHPLAQDATGPQLGLQSTRGHRRLVPMPPSLAPDLQALQPDPPAAAEFVFRTQSGRPLDRGHVRKILRRAAQRAGVTLPISPESLRHAHASHARARGETAPEV